MINHIILKIRRLSGTISVFFSTRATVSEVSAFALILSTILFITTARFIDFNSPGFVIAGFILITILVIFYLLRLRDSANFIFQLYLFLIVFILGFTSCISRYNPPEKIGSSGILENVLILHGGDLMSTRNRIIGKGRILGIVKNSSISRRFFNRNVIYDLSPAEEVLLPGTITVSSGYFSRINYKNLKNTDSSLRKITPGYANYLLSTNTVGYYYGYSRSTEVYRNPSIFRTLSFKLKGYIREVFENLIPWPQSSFCEAIITGNREGIPEYISSIFKESGTVHILAVSGLHVGILIGLVTVLLRIFQVNLRISLGVGIVIAGIYAGFIGNRVSVQRASLMTALGIVGFLLDRDRDFLNILSLSFIFLWIFNPFFVYNPGFLLSFSSVLGIVLFAPYLQRFLIRFLNPYISGLIASTLSVQVFLMPIMLYFFGEYALSNIAANLFIIPLMSINLGLDILLLIIYPISILLANVLAEVTTVIVTGIFYISYLFSWFPQIRVAGFPGYGVILYFLLVLSFTLGFKIRDFNARRV